METVLDMFLKLQNTKDKTLGIFQSQTGPPQMGGNQVHINDFTSAHAKVRDNGHREKAVCFLWAFSENGS